MESKQNIENHSFFLFIAGGGQFSFKKSKWLQYGLQGHGGDWNVKKTEAENLVSDFL
jgi:hypothetical protein